MLKLPKTVSAHFIHDLEDCVKSETLEELFKKIAPFIQRHFLCEDVVVGYEVSEDLASRLVLTSSRRKNAPEGFSEEFSTRWISSGIHEQVLSDLRRRLAPVSYSTFSWPYRAAMQDKDTAYRCPRDYNLFLPFSSQLVVTDEKERTYFGYIGVLFDRFPDFGDDALQLIVTFPALMSEIVSVFVRDR